MCKKLGLLAFSLADAVTVLDFDHHWGITGHKENTKINYFGRVVYRDEVIMQNRRNLIEKWFGNQDITLFPELESK